MAWRPIALSVLLAGGSAAPIGPATFATTPAAAAGPTTACAHRVSSDFDGDGYADIAIGEPWRAVDQIVGAGAVRIVRGTASGAGTQTYVDQDTAGIPGAPTPNDTFGISLAAGFFNDDCYADLAVGTPGENDVTVLYGSQTGLITTGAAQFHGKQGASGFGFALATGDFNGDGRDDLAVSAPYLDNGGGAVTTMLGGATGLGAPQRWLNQSTSGVPGVDEIGDLFGLSLAAGDFTGDGVADLAVGVPLEDVGTAADAGSVTVLKGSKTSGITTSGAQLWSQDSSGVPGIVEAQDHFGYALAAGDVTGDGKADLAVGVPGEDDDHVTDGGAADFLRGAGAGLTGTGALTLTQDTTGVPGAAERGDYLGEAIAVGDVNGDGRADVILGVPGEDLPTASGKNAVNAGAADVLPGTASGPTGTAATGWSQDSPGVPGAVEAGDQFGSTVHVARVRGGAAADLIVAAQLEDGKATDCGGITLLPGTAKGPMGTGSQTFGASSGVQLNDEFGAALG
jgi:hypothetical protein